MRDWLLLAFSTPLLVYVVWQGLGVIGSIMVRRMKRYPSVGERRSGRVAILYTTCDDFDPDSCATLLAQEGIDFDLFILDDSTDPQSKQQVDAWAQHQGTRVEVVRRPQRSGFKGGNINHWLEHLGDPAVYPFLLVVDADERLPSDFASRLLDRLAPGYAFAQACHLGTANLRTSFQSLLHPQVECVWFFSVPAREIFGIAPALGHGILIHTESLKSVGGFPDVVSEDLGLTILLAERGEFGLIATDVVGYESMPATYRDYWRRRRRWIQADAEIIRTLLVRLWRSRIPWRARIDLSLRELRLAVGAFYWVVLLIVAISGFLFSTSVLVLSVGSWALLPILLIPALSALFIRRQSWLRRFAYVLAMPVVGAATISLHPVATLAGFLGRRDFESTGSRVGLAEKRLSVLLVWELLSCIIFIAGGIAGENLALVSVGIAIGCSPLMRTKLETVVLSTAVVLFWALVFSQLYFDLVAGSVPVEHLLALIGITLTLE